jgi:hypothetical protein
LAGIESEESSSSSTERRIVPPYEVGNLAL